MPKILFKQSSDFIRTNGPKALKFIRENWKPIASAAPLVGDATKTIKDYFDNKKNEEKVPNGKTHYRKNKYIKYKRQILLELEEKNRIELHKYESEVKQYIKRINNEEIIDFGMKKPLHTKRINNWNAVLIQLQDTIKLKDYQEYLRIYNDSSYQSSYFKGFEVLENKIKQLINNSKPEQLYEFINNQTKISIEEIQNDFL